MDRRPIGVFDSGLGGLCAVRELNALLPGERIIYFGDTGRVPYGTRSAETIKKYAMQDVRFLLSRGVKAILAACGTVSSVALEELKKSVSVALFGVVDDAVSTALSVTKNGKIAVIGTEATIASGVMENKLKAGGASTVGVACPLFVSLVECGFIGENDGVALAACEKYLAAVRTFGADTLIMGCTHFPIIEKAISKVLPGVTLINPSKEAAAALTGEISKRGLDFCGDGGTQYFVSDEPERFGEVAKIFMGSEVAATKIDIENY